MARRADFRDVSPATPAEFHGAIVPCLALVAPVGMTDDDRDVWLEAAYVALAGIPVGLLERGARAAMATADHPSKIVPAIMAAVGKDWSDRRERSGHAVAIAAPAETISAEERAEVGQLMAGLVKRLEGRSGGDL